MNVLNRILMVLAILLGLFVVLFVMIRPVDAVDLVRANLDYFAQGLFDDQFFFIFLAATGALEFVLLVLFWLELRRPRRKTVRVKTKGGGTAQLGVQSVAQSLEYRIDELAGVRKVRPSITSRGRDIRVAIDLDTSPSVNIPVLTDQIMDLCHDIVERQLGVRIHGKVQINVRHEPYPRGTMPPKAPMGEKSITPPPAMMQPAAPEPVVAKATPEEVEPAPLGEETSPEEPAPEAEQHDQEDASAGW